MSQALALWRQTFKEKRELVRSVRRGRSLCSVATSHPGTELGYSPDGLHMALIFYNSCVDKSDMEDSEAEYALG